MNKVLCNRKAKLAMGRLENLTQFGKGKKLIFSHFSLNTSHLQHSPRIPIPTQGTHCITTGHAQRQQLQNKNPIPVLTSRWASQVWGTSTLLPTVINSIQYDIYNDISMIDLTHELQSIRCHRVMRKIDTKLCYPT